MKKQACKYIALALSLLLILPWLAACGDKKDESVEQETGSVVESDSNVPQSVRFDGEKMNILIHSLMKDEFQIEEGSTAIIDEAVLKRNQQTSDRLGVELNFMVREDALSGAYQTVIRNSISSGDNSVDMISGNAYYTATLAAEGVFYDLNTDSKDNYVATDEAWYNESFVNNTAYHNKLYFIVGDVTIGATDRTPVTFFNEKALGDWGIEDNIYEVALEGKWTIEYMKTLIADVFTELDNQEGETKGDFYGLFFNGGSMCVDAMLYAAGISITETDEDGEISLAWGNNGAADGFAAIYDLMYNADGVFLGTVGGGTYYGETTNYYSEQAFMEGRALFSFGMLNAAKTFALSPDLSYGMLPLPKFSENQDYRTTPQDGFTVMALPYNMAGHTAMATATLEIMSEFSYKTIRPVYHDTAYKVRYASSEDTGLLFDTIIESITYDFGCFYSNSLGNPVHKLRNRLVGTGMAASSNLTGVTAMYTTSTNKLLEDLLTKFDQFGENG